MQYLQPNTTLQGGKYRIERVLGQGGFGITYLAKQVALGRQVAIKEFFMKDFCSRDEVTRTIQAPTFGSSKLVGLYKQKFIKEARNLARLHHEHIIKVIDVFEENDTVYYTMPYMPGGSLQDYVEKHGALSETEAMKYVRQIADALKYMHENEHICHYDVKPSNILLDGKSNAILIDFGISKNYDARGHETSSTPIGLSEGYAPIEQYQQNIEDFSPASDVYALGATLYFLLHAKRPISAVSRAGGLSLFMSSHLSQHVKDIINSSMKISKRERANSIDVFLATASTSGNSTIRWITAFGAVGVLGCFVYDHLSGEDNSSYAESHNTSIEVIQTSKTQAQETTTDIYKVRVEQFTKKQSGVVASFPNDNRYCVYYSKKDEHGRKYLYHYDAITDRSKKMNLPIEATDGDYTNLWVTKNRYIFVAAEYRYTDFIRIDTETNQVKYITDCKLVKRSSKGFTLVMARCTNEYEAQGSADMEYAYTDHYYNEEGTYIGQGSEYTTNPY